MVKKKKSIIQNKPGLVLAFSGQASKVTEAFLSLAIHAQKNEVISLGKWNRELTSSPRKR